MKLPRLLKRILPAITVLSGVSLPCITKAAPAAAIEEITPSGDNSVLPALIAQTAAIFPSNAINDPSKPVIVGFTVDESGQVRSPQVLSTPSPELEGPALKAVASWKFTAGSRSGRPAAFKLKAPVTFSVKASGIDAAPTAMRKVQPVYPYEQLIKGQSGWGESSFVIDYSGRTIFTAPTAASQSDFAKAVNAMVEASEFTPGKKDKRAVMASLVDRQFFSPEASLDPVAKEVLAELRKAQPKIYNVSDLDGRPKPVSQRSAVYPRSLKSDGLTGQAEVEFIIDRDGRVLFPHVLSASHEDFGWAAATAVSQWKFNPPMRNGQRVEARVTMPILFDAQKLASSE